MFAMKKAMIHLAWMLFLFLSLAYNVWSLWADSYGTLILWQQGEYLGWTDLLWEHVNMAAVPIALLCWELSALQIEEGVTEPHVMYHKGCPFLPCFAAPRPREAPGLFPAFPFLPAVPCYHPLRQHCCFPARSLFAHYPFYPNSSFHPSGSARRAPFPGKQSRVKTLPSPGCNLRLTRAFFIFSWDFNWPGICVLRILAEGEVFPKPTGNSKVEERPLAWMPFYRIFSLLRLETSEPFLSPKVSFYKYFPF